MKGSYSTVWMGAHVNNAVRHSESDEAVDRHLLHDPVRVGQPRLQRLDRHGAVTQYTRSKVTLVKEVKGHTSQKKI